MRYPEFTDEELERLTVSLEEKTPWRSWSHHREESGEDTIVVVNKRPQIGPLRIVKTPDGLYAARGPRMWDVILAEEIDQLIDYLAKNFRRPS